MLKILHIGCGSISRVWLSSIMKRSDVKICGIVDLNITSALKTIKDFSLHCPAFTDTKTAIEETRPDIAIDNIVPAGRLELAKLCMSEGLHVFSEKPLGDSIDSAVHIIKLSKKYNRSFFVMQNRRYNTGILSFRNTIQSGAIGDIGYLGAEFFRDPRFGGFREEMSSPLLIDMAIHTFDQARFLLGKDPISVSCKEYNPVWSVYKGNASAVCIFTFEGGTVFNYTGSWCAPGMDTSWDSSWRAVGSHGTCMWNGTDLPKAQTPEKSVDIKIDKCHFNGHEGCIDEMINCIKSDSTAQTDCRDNIKSLAMVFAAILSSNENREVYISELLEGIL